MHVQHRWTHFDHSSKERFVRHGLLHALGLGANLLHVERLEECESGGGFVQKVEHLLRGGV